MNATCVLENKNLSCCWGVPTVGSPLSEGQRPMSGRGKKNNFPEWLQSYSRHGDTVLLNARINQHRDTIRWVMAAGSNAAFKIAAQPPQIETWLLLTAYVKSPSPYPIIPSSTLYDVKLRTDRWQTHDISYPKNRCRSRRLRDLPINC